MTRASGKSENEHKRMGVCGGCADLEFVCGVLEWLLSTGDCKRDKSARGHPGESDKPKFGNHHCGKYREGYGNGHECRRLESDRFPDQRKRRSLWSFRRHYPEHDRPWRERHSERDVLTHDSRK